MNEDNISQETNLIHIDPTLIRMSWEKPIDPFTLKQDKELSMMGGQSTVSSLSFKKSSID